ncbi:hypothetical protein CpecG_0511 [Chlamydia pecorum MC/MarsBar]|nr:hypothetical protein CpecF_0513 [Chlamydia pecorum DBDeUG]ETF40086.1 hypothetical protein CpecG_0511 [Chlamydia pecorum MC/MarsBar]ETF40621.1 hypothetical protein CpecA_0515 [Chlamydia pecorum IPTaLE]
MKENFTLLKAEIKKTIIMKNKTIKKRFSSFLTLLVYNGISFLDELLGSCEGFYEKGSIEEKRDLLIDSVVQVLYEYKHHLAKSQKKIDHPKNTPNSPT